MAARFVQEWGSLTIRKVEETANGHVIAYTDDGTVIRFDTAADVRDLQAALEPAAVLLEAREAGQVAAA